MKKLTLLTSLLIFINFAHAQETDFWNAENLNSNRECLLSIVRKQLYSDKTSPAPQLKMQSTTSLEEFQNAMEKWWGFRPEFFVNVYDADTNTIYLTNLKARYKFPRTPVDSLVHELVHFVQSKDKGAHKGENEEFYEEQAVRVQTWFRDHRGSFIENETYRGPCE